MIVIQSNISLAGTIEWLIFDPVDLEDEEGVIITFTLYGRVENRLRMRKFREKIESTDISWLSCEKNDCTLNLDDLRNQFKDLQEFDWLKGRISIDPDFEKIEEDSREKRL